MSPGPSPTRLGVAFGWHVHPFEDLLALVRRAEALGYETAYVDGDVSVVPSRGEADVLDGWTVTSVLLARSERIRIGSLRIAEQWNIARLAQAAATLERIEPGRLDFLVSIGGQPADRRFGYPLRPAGERIRQLDEMLEALRALWAGQSVTRRGRYVRLEEARVRPVPPEGIRVAIAARRPRMLELVARHGDAWDMNVPPVKSWVEPCERDLAHACRAVGRDPAALARSLWIFTRLAGPPTELRAEYRRLNPWFRDLPDQRLDEAIVSGSPEACRSRIEELREALRLDLPVLDLSGLGRAASEALLEACAPEKADPTRRVS